MSERRKWWSPVYRWADGSTVFARTSLPEGSSERLVVEFEIEVAGMTGIVKFDIFDRGAPEKTVQAESRSEWPAELERKVLAFVLDLGAVRYNEQHEGLLYNSSVSGVPLAVYPRFVSDERWKNRYREARSLFNSKSDGDFLGVLFDAEFQRGGTQFDADWGRGGVTAGTVSVPRRLGFEVLVDRVCEQALLLPESRRAAWEAEHAARGQWLMPSPDEVGLFQLLGEALPFWWGSERFFAWIEERR